ncbi:MAG: hypothetical protein QW835_03775 [Candidatus Hadarchaeum sp.]
MTLYCLSCRNCDGQLFAVDPVKRELFCAVCGSNKIAEVPA